MKIHSIFLILFLFLGFFTVNAQSYKAAFRADMCSCLEEESLKRQLTENAFKACLRETLPNYATQIDAQITDEDANKKYYQGQLARKNLMVSMQSELIYSCDVYYEHIYFIRNSTKLIARENAKENELEKYNEMVALTPNAMAYYMRAELHFKLGNIKEAEADINTSLSLNPNKDNAKATRQELLLLAWIYEEQDRYKEAITLYDQIYFGDLDTQVSRLRALADKQSGGSISNIPKKGQPVEEKEVQKTSRNRDLGRKATTNKPATPSKNKSENRANSVEKKKDTSSLRKLLKIDNF